jgi:hypothetical protein
VWRLRRRGEPVGATVAVLGGGNDDATTVDAFHVADLSEGAGVPGCADPDGSLTVFCAGKASFGQSA